MVRYGAREEISVRSELEVLNSSYRSYQRFDLQTRPKGQFCIVLTL